MIGQSQAQPRQNNTCHVVDVGNEDDPITDLFTSIVDKSPNDESADQNIEIENPIVEEILNSNQSEDEYGPPLGLKVAAAFKRLIAQPASKEHIDQNKIKLKIPENIKEMRAPKVNCEIWTQLPKKAQVIDASQQFVQQFVSRVYFLVQWKPQQNLVWLLEKLASGDDNKLNPFCQSKVLEFVDLPFRSQKTYSEII
ncbi:uncharacterized protein LOC118437705 [Folsomia candida]|uniref:uncharacterized protein LOC118437705 n=1 Tax=Folsomia candida TaxID=158441 RepID=UPI0016052E91|nr:uncharacterized protein LOC118437705 [Folsomia candida]